MVVKKRDSLAIGLTGGPGVGKSEVAKILAANGAAIICADKIGHHLLDENKPVKRKLVKLLGDNIIAEDKPNRREIGRLVFGDSETLYSFNQIIHPPLLKILKKELADKIRTGSNRMVAVDAALIFEWGVAEWFDLLLVITATREIRLKRMCDTGLSRYQAGKRIASQIPQRDKIALADFIIENNSTRSTLKSKVKGFIRAIEEVT
ncbi:MAG: dephospho-CoA kinase [candidate division Zixibacteria bacterium]|nr:dephospho-CoA kinase [candidate division Zixibacteria bacterium]